MMQDTFEVGARSVVCSASPAQLIKEGFFFIYLFSNKDEHIDEHKTIF